MRRAALLLVGLLLACGDLRGLAPGALIEVSGPVSIQDATVQLRVQVGSALPGRDLVLRGDEIVDVSDWPAEFFVRATDTSRVWSVDVWALDEDGAVIGTASAGGEFEAGKVRKARMQLTAPATSQGANADSQQTEPGRDDASADAGATRDGGASDSGVASVLDSGKQDAGRDAGSARDALVDAAPTDSSPQDATPDAGATQLDAGPARCAVAGTSYSGVFQGTLMRPTPRSVSIPFTFTLEYFFAPDTLTFTGSLVHGVDALGIGFQATIGASLVDESVVLTNSEIFVDNLAVDNVIRGRLGGSCSERSFSGTWSYAAADGSESGSGTWAATPL